MTTPKTNRPKWLNQSSASFEAAESHMQILYGDVSGYAVPGVTQTQYLARVMGGNGRTVAYYDRARGITFTSEAERKAAAELIATYDQKRQAREQMKGATTGTGVASGALAAQLRQVAAGGAAPSQADGDPFEGTENPRAALPVLNKLLRAEAERVTVIIQYADTLLPNAPKAQMPPDNLTLLVTLLSWANDDSLGVQANPVFLMCNRLGDLHDDLTSSTSGIRAIKIAMPDREARQHYIEWYIARRAEERVEALANDAPAQPAITLAPGYTTAIMANSTAGLSLRHIENILLLAANEGGITPALVKATKDDIITSEYSEVAEMIEPLPGGFASLGGMEVFKGWARADVIDAVREGRYADVPKGVLLVGPPGTGKTFGVRALAQEIGFNAVALRSENVLGGIVGESERKLKQFFDFAKALAPTLIFVDEIDQSDMGSRGNSSGNPVAKNLFNQMLQFLSDETLRGKVIMVFASNRPDLLDPAMLRFGRMDAIIPVLLPEASARQGIIAVQAKTQGVEIASDALAWLADDAQTKNYSAADLAAVVSKARKIASRQGGQSSGARTITRQHVQTALRNIRPSTTSMAEEYTRLAILACNDAEFLPADLAKLIETDEAREQTEREVEERGKLATTRKARGGF